MKKNSARMLLCAGLCAAAVIGTGLISYAASSSDSAAAQTDSRMPPQEDGSVMAKITAAGDGSLTVTIARKPEGKNGMEQMAQKAGPRTKRPRLKNLKLVRPCMMGRKTGTLWMGRIKAA